VTLPASLPREILEVLDDAALVTDAGGTILWASSGVERLWGYTAAEVSRKKLQFLVSYESSDPLDETIDPFSDRLEIARRRTLEAYRKGGATFPVRLNRIPLGERPERRILVLLRDASELRDTRDRLRRLQTALATAQTGVAIADRNLTVLWANPALAAMHESAEREIVGRPLGKLLPEALARVDFRELAAFGSHRRESIARRASGVEFPVELTFDLVRDDQGEPEGVVALCQDITQRRRTETALRESEERYALAVRGANDGLWDWNLSTGEIHFSPRWQQMLGLDPDENETRPEAWFSRVHPEDLPRLHQKLDRHLAGESELFEDEHRIEHRDGNYRWMLARGAALFDVDGKAHRIAGSQTDITDRKVHDPLTGLPNRALFVDRLERARARARRSGRTLYAVLFLDLDRFKVVNDSLGHPVGDQLLVAVAQRVEGCLRSGDTVARLGGDEFAVLLEEVAELDEAIEVANRIHTAFAMPLLVGGHELFLTVSIGIALGSSETQDLSAVLRDADTAMYRAKTSGRGRSQVFTGEMRSEVMAQLRLENDLRRAVERKEFEVYYQPILTLKSSTISGLEALVRWRHPERGLIEPGEFIAAAEETGIILPLGMWVLEESCRQLRAWQLADPRWSALTMSVNLSPKLFAQPDLVGEIQEILRRTGLAATKLKLEITEGVLVQNPEVAGEMLRQLRALGIGVCIDDFGTGYSSLSYLTSFSVDVLKIDRSFISNLSDPGGGSELVRNIVRLAAGLGLAVVAEGVETKGQSEQLAAMNCEFVQGFHFSRPVDADTVWKRLLDHP
jgi:diguanylate cyclase (GGDEF)-like protein/PAS domain S-box-containing protein